MTWTVDGVGGEMTNPGREEPREITDWRGAVRDATERLERDYFAKVKPYAEGFGTWANSTLFGYEIPLREHGRIGGGLIGSHARYARKVGFLGLFGRRVLVLPLSDIERQFRAEIDAWLKEEEQKRGIPK
jgi:hypothetical protein